MRDAVIIVAMLALAELLWVLLGGLGPVPAASAASAPCQELYVDARQSDGTCPLASQRIEAVPGVLAYVCRCPGGDR